MREIKENNFVERRCARERFSITTESEFNPDLIKPDITPSLLAIGCLHLWDSWYVNHGRVNWKLASNKYEISPINRTEKRFAMRYIVAIDAERRREINVPSRTREELPTDQKRETRCP